MNIDSGRIDIKIRNVYYKTERDVLPYYRTGKRHSNGFVFYVKGGHSHVTEDGAEYRTQDRYLLYLPYGASYVNRVIGTGIEYFQINFEIFENGERVSLSDKIKIISPPLSESLLQYFIEIRNLYAAKPYAYQLSSLGNLLHLISAFLQEFDFASDSSLARKRIAVALNYLKDEYYKNMSIKELASLCNMSVSSLEKNFLCATGRTPSDYRNSIRIEHAKNLLLGGFSITEVAERVGYSDVYYFARMFKRYTGQPPGKYKRGINTT